MSAPAFADPAAQTLYRDAIKARHAGDFAAAIAKLEAAARLDPNNPEILRELGTVLGYARRFDEAVAVLERARRLAPEDTDIVLALARVEGYRGDYAEAEREIAPVLAADPGNAEAHALAGRLAYYQSDLTRAEEQFKAALVLDPAEADAQSGLRDVQKARAAQAPAYRYRLDSFVSWSEFARRPLAPWYETFNQLTGALDPTTDLHGRIDVSRRFGAVDTYLETGADHRFAPWLSGYVYAGATPHATFRERWTVLAGGSLRVIKGGGTSAGTLLTLDAKDALYRTGFVRMANPGVQQYLFAGRAWLTLKAIETWAAGGRYLPGYFLRADFQASDPVLLYAGFARAADTEENVTAYTRSAFAGAGWTPSPRLTLHLDYTHDDRQGGYVRHAVTVGATLHF